VIRRYVDSSVIISAYDARGDGRASSILDSSDEILTSRLVHLEVLRNLRRLVDAGDTVLLMAEFEFDFARMTTVEISEVVWRLASAIAVDHGVKSLDALHLATALSVGLAQLEFVTFDRAQARAAERLGMPVHGP
jgi:predicted nucleic acid-binding protein